MENLTWRGGDGVRGGGVRLVTQFTKGTVDTWPAVLSVRHDICCGNIRDNTA